MGDFQPEAHVKGLDGCNLMALILRSFSAVNFCSVFILVVNCFADQPQKYAFSKLFTRYFLKKLAKKPPQG
jgi:hypothetical protein